MINPDIMRASEEHMTPNDHSGGSPYWIHDPRESTPQVPILGMHDLGWDQRLEEANL